MTSNDLPSTNSPPPTDQLEQQKAEKALEYARELLVELDKKNKELQQKNEQLVADNAFLSYELAQKKRNRAVANAIHTQSKEMPEDIETDELVPRDPSSIALPQKRRAPYVPSLNVPSSTLTTPLQRPLPSSPKATKTQRQTPRQMPKMLHQEPLLRRQ